MRMTRKERAADLMQMLDRGPSLGFPTEVLSKPEAEARVRNWLRSWIIPNVKRLVPELKEKRDAR